MQHVRASHRIHLISPQGFNGKRAPVCCQKLDLVRLTAGVDLHDRANVASDQPIGGQILPQLRDTDGMFAVRYEKH
mgnify:CR=1 FL=1